LLRWLPVVGGLRPFPVEILSIQRRPLLALCLLIASFSITLLIFTPAPQAIGQIIALNFACLLALFDWRENWLPNYILFPMLLAALLNSVFLGTAQSAILGATIAWLITAAGLVCLSITLRRNFVSGDYMALVAICGASVGLGSVWTFLLLSAFLLWLGAIFRRYRNTTSHSLPFGTTCAVALALTFLCQHLPNLTNAFPELSQHITQKVTSSSLSEH
ncbi:hypothetical protein, partial [Acetobacter malorum]|uniref:hypothetical protein n=1 Tax=Acetobacter malorum TaxID=178901 RepID=UPI000AD6FB76